MESKTKHRILGAVVMAGLAVLMYPLIQGNDNLPNEQALVKAPAFPDQAVQVSADAPDEAISNTTPKPNVASTDMLIEDKVDQSESDNPQSDPNVANVSAQTLAPAPEAPAAVEAQAKPEPEAAAQPEVSQAASEEPVSEKAVTTESNAQAAANNAADAPAADKPEPKKAAAPVSKKSVKTAAKTAGKVKVYSHIASKPGFTAEPLNSNGLMELKRAAWVIQLGSFKQKANALRLVNKLRANGYRAFIQNVSASSGENTRVFVGPEHHQSSARLVASELEKEMKLHGIVISYQPFSL